MVCRLGVTLGHSRPLNCCLSLTRKDKFPLLGRRFFSSKRSANNFQRRILSGIQPTGVPTLGNYLGALRRWVDIQNREVANEEKCLYFLADLHALTIPQDPKQLKQYIYDMTATLLACGIDPSKSAIFQQSSVSGHAELTWLLMCYTSMGQLNRMTQFKSKANSRDGVSAASAGLFSYPVLMAADILLYKATGIPVGDDQSQHLELARDIAERFNHTHKCDLLQLPEPMISKSVTSRVMSLQDGTKKMSKSDPSEKSRILLTDSAAKIKKKISSAATDSLGPIDSSVYESKDRLNVRNLIGIYSAFSKQTVEESVKTFEGQNMSNFKKSLTEILVEHICPIGSEIQRLQNDKAYLDTVLHEGSIHAGTIAEETISEVKDIIGL